jgi:hypothetical protein
MPAAASDTAPEQVGLVDTASGKWHLRHLDGITTSFFYGNPGDDPLMGDWDCDGIDTPAMYRRSTGFIHLRNANSHGPGEVSYFFGNPSDIPLAGDWDGDGCDTVGIYRPTEGRVYIKNSLGTGVADYSYYFGNPGDKPFAGDFNGDGISTVGLHRESSGFLYFRNSNTPGVADNAFFYGIPNDRLIAGDWTGHDIQTFGVFRPSESRFYLRYSNTQGFADQEFVYGQGSWLPVAGNFGPLIPDGATTTVTSAETTTTPVGEIPTTSVPGLTTHSVGYIGCSNTSQTVEGYHDLGFSEEVFWEPDKGDDEEDSGGTIASWANPSFKGWREFDQQVALYGDPALVWIQICDNEDPSVTLEHVEQAILNLRAHVPESTILYVSPLNAYQPKTLCDLVGPDGIEDNVALVDQAVGMGLTLPGPELGPLTIDTTRADRCHPNGEGMALLGEQLAEFFHPS